MINDSTLKAAHAEIRRKKVQQWKQEYLKTTTLWSHRNRRTKTFTGRSRWFR